MVRFAFYSWALPLGWPFQEHEAWIGHELELIVLACTVVNGRDKVICVRNLPPSSILSKVQLLLDSSGSKIVSLKRPKVESRTESVRGVWSAFHE